MPGNSATTAPINWKAPKLKGKTFAFTGRLEFLPRSHITPRVKAEGGRVAAAVNGRVNYLVVGRTRASGPTAAEKKAQRLNQKGASIQVIDESAFHALFTPTRDEAVAMLRAGAAGHKRLEALRDHSWTVPMPDLSGADLRGMRLDNVPFALAGVRLDGADLRGAILVNRNCLGDLRDVRLDGARLEDVWISGMAGCSLRNADLSGGYFSAGPIQHCDFTGARMRGVEASYLKTTGAVFRGADLQEAHLERSLFPAADFSGADLSRACLANTDFSGATLRRAKLVGADLPNAKLAGGDLTGADLSEANLTGADLTGAMVDGANFEGAKLLGTKLAGLDPKKARGLDPTQARGQNGPHLRELDRVAKRSHRLETTAVIMLPNKEAAEARVTSDHLRPYVSMQAGTPATSYGTRPTSLSAGMIDFARRYARGELRLDLITAKASKCPRKRNELHDLAVAAWCEACGLDVPTPEAFARLQQSHQAGQQELREQLLADLRGGTAGVRRWNGSMPQERKRAGHFRRVNLSGAKLRGADLGGLDFRGANFEGATLARAQLGNYGDFRDANFKGADLREAHLGIAKFAGADFTGANLRGAQFTVGNLRKTVLKDADLTGANLMVADLRGTDLTGAKLDEVKFLRTRYDQQTRLPDGFEPPEGMEWAGVGQPPGAGGAPARQPAGPLDFDTFMQRLAQNTDAARLANALRMLKADRFQLFAQAGEEQLVGVVKSQTDPGLVYSCKLAADGSFGCCTQNLRACGGLSGQLCKHLLVLLIGLTKAGQVDPARMDAWVANSRLRKPALDKEAMSETLLRYKGAEAGEIDWRPTETIPEDYYAL